VLADTEGQAVHSPSDTTSHPRKAESVTLGAGTMQKDQLGPVSFNITRYINT
jgi:hypothetical protein